MGNAASFVVLLYVHLIIHIEFLNKVIVDTVDKIVNCTSIRIFVLILNTDAATSLEDLSVTRFAPKFCNVLLTIHAVQQMVGQSLN